MREATARENPSVPEQARAGAAVLEHIAARAKPANGAPGCEKPCRPRRASCVAAPHRCRQSAMPPRANPSSAGKIERLLRCEHRRWRRGCAVEEPERAQRLLQLKHVALGEVGHAQIQRAVAQIVGGVTSATTPSVTPSLGGMAEAARNSASGGGSVIEMPVMASPKMPEGQARLHRPRRRRRCRFSDRFHVTNPFTNQSAMDTEQSKWYCEGATPRQPRLGIQRQILGKGAGVIDNLVSSMMATARRAPPGRAPSTTGSRRDAHAPRAPRSAGRALQPACPR